MIYITGDTHGDIDYDKLLFLKEKHLSYDDYLIICGDCGICWSKSLLPSFLKLYNAIGCTILYVDGNHENFNMIDEFPIVEFKGARMHQIDEHIHHILRGEIMELEGKTFLCLGGAVSTDKNLRTENVSWWSNEEISDNDIDNAIKNLQRYGNKVDYVITHCIDTQTVLNTFGYRRDKCTDQLNFIDLVCEYKHWYFGHYHIDRQLDVKKTCLYQNIIEIK